MARRVLTAPRRGGYKYQVLTAEQRERDYIRVRRKIKVGRGPARRRRFWIEREGEVYEYTRYYVEREPYQGRKGESLKDAYEVRIQKRIPRGADSLDYYPEEKLWGRAAEAYDALKGADLTEPKEGIRKVGKFTSRLRVARMGEGWRELSYVDL